MAASGNKSPRGLKPAPQGLAPVFITVGGPQAHADTFENPRSASALVAQAPCLPRCHSWQRRRAALA